MTSTPVSLNDSSLNGSWIDINSASQIPSPFDNSSEPPEFLAPPYSPTYQESIQNNNDPQQQQANLGLISFQVERFLQENANHSQPYNSGNNQQQQLTIGNLQPAADNDRNLNKDNNITIKHKNNNNSPFQKVNYPTNSNSNNTTTMNNNNNQNDDNNSGIYVSDSEISLDDFDSKALMKSLKWIQQQERFANNNFNNQEGNNVNNNNNNNIIDCLAKKHRPEDNPSIDQLSDSLSLLSRASALNEQNIEQNNFDDFDWLWDWTAQPEYFTGQEWKVYAPKQDYLMKQRQMYQRSESNRLSGDVVSLLFLTNFLSIIIGAGLTYSIMMRRSSV